MEVRKHMAQDPFSNQAPIKGVKKIIAIGSGKGGVGKSTVSSNLAMALAEKDYKVGLLDADIYGPSLPSIFGCFNQRPEVNKEDKIIPISRYGIKLMSMGFLVEEDQPVVWRGPMLFKAMDQFLRDVEWGELDYLLVDLPPGTGDIVLTLAQKAPIDQSIVVTTPQTLSLSEVKKAIMMFKQIGVPTKVIVQNMSGMMVNGERIDLFPTGPINNIKESYGIPNLVEVPFDPKIGMSAEAGIPYFKSLKENTPAKDTYKDLANLIG